jgi:endonuclease/exonuclease/phosphatase (EEP) superfamily protein YafD
MVRRAVLALAIAALTVPATASAAKPTPLRVMTYNLYQGSELTHTLAAGSIAALPAAVAADFNDVQASDIPARMAVVAAEIKAARSDLVGLEEAALWRTQSPSNLSVPAKTVAYDFVAILLQALRRLGVSYRAAAIVENSDVQAPASFPSGSMDVRLTDRVAVLARAGVKVSHVTTRTYRATAKVTVPAGLTIAIKDGFAALDAKRGAREVRFVATHLDALSEPVRTAQASELVSGPAKGRGPTVLVGDFNSATTTAAYATIASSGIRDTWLQAMPAAPGFACCHNPADLTAASPALSASTTSSHAA